MIHDNGRTGELQRAPLQRQAAGRATAPHRTPETPAVAVPTRLSGSVAPGYLTGESSAAGLGPVVADVLRRPGQPLAPGHRADMEARLGADFSSVRLHTDIAAQRSAAALGARAYTVGDQIVAGAPGLDRHTLVHELTHVLQQRAGSVSGTDLGDGLRVSDPCDRFERAAEDNARRVLAGAPPSTMGTPAAAGMATARADGPTVQRLFGMEKETKVPVRLDNERIPGYPTIAEVPDLLKVDVDHSGGESILEFVLKAFDEHSGSDREAHAELDRRLKVMEDLVAASIAAPQGSLLEDIVDLFNGSALGSYTRATLNDYVPATPDSGPVHFTVGFSLAAMPELIRERLTNLAVTKGDRATRRAGQASTLANWTLAQPGVPGKANLAGFIATVYLQAAAIMDGVKGAQGLRKNKTNALARVSLDVMFGNLQPGERDWLTRRMNVIIDQMRSLYSGHAGVWGTSHKKDAVLMPPPLKSLLRAAFEGVPYNPVADFGEMTVVGQAEAVGPKGEELGDRGYAMELRRENISSQAPRAERIARAHDLLEYSRRLHGSDDYSVFMATSSSLS